MKALTIHQPWADAIVHGPKRVENRSWASPRGAAGTRILIHAGRRLDPMGLLVINGWKARESWPGVRGAILASALLTGSHYGTGCCDREWAAPNCWHWQLTDVRVLSEPLPCRGAQRLWTPQPSIQSRLHELDAH